MEGAHTGRYEEVGFIGQSVVLYRNLRSGGVRKGGGGPVLPPDFT